MTSSDAETDSKPIMIVIIIHGYVWRTGWLAPVPGDDTRARCRYCRMLLRAHYNDLRAHSRTIKHANNVAFALPCDDAGVGVALSPAAAASGGGAGAGGGRGQRRGAGWWARGARNKLGEKF